MDNDILNADGIKAELRAREISTQHIAEEVGVHISYIYKVLNGGENRWADTSTRIREAIASCLEKDITELDFSSPGRNTLKHYLDK